MLIDAWPAVEPYAELRRRMIRETEAFLEDALRHPQDFPRIPAARVGTRFFSAHLAVRFWGSVLGGDGPAARR